jgi:hypothetical protein
MSHGEKGAEIRDGAPDRASPSVSPPVVPNADRAALPASPNEWDMLVLTAELERAAPVQRGIGCLKRNLRDAVKVEFATAVRGPGMRRLEKGRYSNGPRLVDVSRQ